MTGYSVVLGIVSGCAFIPLAIMSPIGGIIADRVNKRNIMVFLDFFTAGLTVLFLIFYGKVSVTGLILAFLFMLYGISGAYQPSVQASIPVLVQPQNVMSANAVINMVSSISGLLGPALGGIAYSLWGIYPVLYAAAICFFVSAVMELFIHIPFTKREKKMSILNESKADLLQSVLYIGRKKPEIGRLTICCAGVNLVMSALMIIGLPVIVMQGLGFSGEEGSRLYGFMQAALAVGGLGAGLLGSRLKARNSWKLIACCGGLLLPMGIVLGTDASAYFTYAVLVISGMFIMALASIYTIQIMSYIQMTVPQEMVGKVIAWVIAVSTCAQPAGQVIYGFLFERLKEEMSWIFYVVVILSLMIAAYSRNSSEKLREV